MCQLLKLFSVALLFLCLPNASAQTVTLEFTDLDGIHRQLSDYRGRWVVVNFWATWCAPCLKEIPELIEFHERHQASIAVVIGVNFETVSLDELETFARALRINYPVFQVGEAPLLPFEPLQGIPSTFFVSPEGELVKSHLGPIGIDELEAALAVLR